MGALEISNDWKISASFLEIVSLLYDVETHE